MGRRGRKERGNKRGDGERETNEVTRVREAKRGGRKREIHQHM